MEIARRVLLLGLVVFALVACGPAGEQEVLGQEFPLYPDESVSIQGTGLTFRLDSVGHGWYADGSGEFAFANLEAALDGVPQAFELEVGDEWNIGEYAIHLLAADPFNENRCEFLVTRAE